MDGGVFSSGLGESQVNVAKLAGSLQTGLHELAYHSSPDVVGEMRPAFLKQASMLFQYLPSSALHSHVCNNQQYL